MSWELLAGGPALTAGLQLALDEVLLDELAVGRRRPALRLWDWAERAVVIGSHQSVRNEVDLEAAARLDFRPVRRMSGGGAMIVEPRRTITWSLYVPAAEVDGMSFAESYRHLDAWAVRALTRLGVPAEHRPLNDIATPRGKLAGSAQARRRGVVLHHTVLAYEMDVTLVRRLLRIGRPRLSPSGLRSAEKEVSPLSWFTDLAREAVVERLAEGFAAEQGAQPGEIGPGTLEQARRLAADKYDSPAWTERLP